MTVDTKKYLDFVTEVTSLPSTDLAALLARITSLDVEGDADIPRLAGWWGHDRESRFTMPSKFKPLPGAEGWQVSNINILSASSLIPSLDIFKASGMTKLRQKSIKMTGYMEFLLDDLNSNKIFEIITPRNEKERGCQLSLLFDSSGIVKGIKIITDDRAPHSHRKGAPGLFLKLEGVFGEDIWNCTDFQAAEGEIPVGASFMKKLCFLMGGEGGSTTKQLLQGAPIRPDQFLGPKTIGQKCIKTTLNCP